MAACNAHTSKWCSCNAFFNHNVIVVLSKQQRPHLSVVLTTVGSQYRYRGEVSHKLAAEVDPAPPEWFYGQAAKVWPEGGQPLNQLAVMALHKRKHLKSAYYYAR